MGIYKGWYEAPRWANFERYLRETCFFYDLDYEIDIQKGIIRESGIFKVTGTDENIKKFINDYHQTAELYNK